MVIKLGERKTSTWSTMPPAYARNVVTQKLMRDLFVVANCLVRNRFKGWGDGRSKFKFEVPLQFISEFNCEKMYKSKLILVIKVALIIFYSSGLDRCCA